MYLPFLRGKQFELISLREFAKEINGSDIVCPVIEPVKPEFKGLDTTVTELINQQVNFVIIINPRIGEIEDPQMVLDALSANKKLKDHHNFQIGINSFGIGQVDNHLKLVEASDFSGHAKVLIHNDVIDDEGFVRDRLNIDAVRYHIFNNGRIKSRRYKRLFDGSKRVTLDDPFVIKEKNADYLAQIDEFFSDEYLNYADEGFVGFSDFLTIGDNYTDSGFLPYAVAIHITYEQGDGSIRIRHFVSDSNDDYSDTPGKFAEALKKLIDFIQTLTFKTKAIREFEAMHARQHYPGLGTVKKLSILHHLELMNTILNR
jgi:hypothetical protein